MVSCYPTTPLKWAMHVGVFLFGTALFCYGGHLAYEDAPYQQALIKARNDYVRQQLKKRAGDA